MTELRVVADEIVELDGIPVARLLPNLTLSLRDKLIEAFDTIGEYVDEDELDAEIERLIQAMAEAGRPQSLTARMRRARMRLVQKSDSPAADAHPNSPGGES